MKLALYGGGDSCDNYEMDKNLLELTNKKNPKMTFIPSCHVHGQEDFLEIINQFRPHGIKKFIKWDIDRPYSNFFKKTVLQSDIIYLGGGNTYYFLKNLKKKGLLKELRSWVYSGGVLVGLSAGAILMTKKIETAGFPSFDKDENDESIKNLKAIGLVDFDFFPHYRNSKRYDTEIEAFSLMQNIPLYACPDGSGIIISGATMSFIGKSACFIQGKKFFINK